MGFTLLLQHLLSWNEVTHEVIITDTNWKRFEVEVERVLRSNSKDSNRLVLMWDDPRVFGRVLEWNTSRLFLVS